MTHGADDAVPGGAVKAASSRRATDTRDGRCAGFALQHSNCAAPAVAEGGTKPTEGAFDPRTVLG